MFPDFFHSLWSNFCVHLCQNTRNSVYRPIFFVLLGLSFFAFRLLSLFLAILALILELHTLSEQSVQGSGSSLKKFCLLCRGNFWASLSAFSSGAITGALLRETWQWFLGFWFSINNSLMNLIATATAAKIVFAVKHTQSESRHHPARQKPRSLLSPMAERIHTKFLQTPQKLPNAEHPWVRGLA